MAISTTNEKEWIQDLLAWSSRPQQGITGPFSWTGNAGQSTTIRYSLESADAFFVNSGITGAPATASDIDATGSEIQAILNLISAVANITFVRDDNDPDIVFAAASLDSDSGRTILDVDGQEAQRADVYISSNQTDFSLNGEGAAVVVHEVMHALGVAHPRESSSPYTSGFDLDFDNLLTAMSYNQNGLNSASASTPMIYDIAALQFLYGSNTSRNEGNTTYTLNENGTISVSDTSDGSSSLAGDLVTVWDSGGTDTYQLNASITDGARIDLRAGVAKQPDSWYSDDETYSTQFDYLDNGGAVVINAFTNGGGHGLGLIENAIGAQGADLIFGNNLNNALQGNGGDDEIDGGNGTDTAVYAGNRADYRILAGSNGVTVEDLNASNGDEGEDTLIRVEKIQFADGIYENGIFRKADLETPVANNDTALAAVNGSVNINVILNDFDPDNQALTIALGTQASDGTATLNQNGTFTYVPDTNFSGTDSFTYTITDADSQVATGTVYVVVGSAISGTSGNDSALDGNSSDNIIVGLAGDDDIDGKAGHDIIHGDDGDDFMFGDAGNDQMFGGTGWDLLEGGDGNDILHGGSGNDAFYGNDGTEYLYGGSGSDEYFFDASVDSGVATINEGDSQGSDVVHLDNISTGDRIEFEYDSGQLIARYYETSGGGADFTFIIDAGDALAGKGVEYITVDGNKTYSTRNIIAAADYAANNTFIFDIEDYEANGYPVLLPESASVIQPAVYNNGGYRMFAGWGTSSSITDLVYAEEIYHSLTAQGGSSPNGSSSSPVVGYIKELNLASGINPDDVRLTVDNNSNAAITLYLENVDVAYTFNYFEDGYSITGYRMNAAGTSNIGTVNGSGSGSWTIIGSNLSFETSSTTNTYFFERLNFANGDSINLRGVLEFEGTNAGETLYGLDRADVLRGYAGNDTLNAKDGADLLDGGDGSDWLYAGAGADTLIGGSGNDYLGGEGGDDAYMLDVGFGTDTIADGLSSGNDTIHISGIDVDDVRLWTDTSGYLHVQNKNDTNDHVTIQAGWSGGNYQSTIGQYVEQIIFADGSVIDLTGGLNIEGTSSNDTLYGTAFGDTLAGLNGADWIYANDGNDTLTGGAGGDSLHGGAGDDTYILGIGFGADTIVESLSSGTETIRITGIDADDIRLWTDTSGYLHLQNKNDLNDHVTVQANWSGGNYQSIIGQYVEQIVFDDETTWSLTGALNIEGTASNDTLYGTAFGDTLTGLNGNDWIYANDGNDTLIGGAGADSLHGNAGNDTYILGVGFGGDTIVESLSSGTETIHLAGVDADDIRLWTDTSGYLHLQNKNDTNDHVTIQAGWSSGNYQSTIGQYVEQVVFDDETTWDLTGALNIEGSSSNDTLYGTAYSDTLTGLNGNDYIYANNGNDTLIGGAGSDSLHGNAGDDTYILGVGFGGDTIVESQSEGAEIIRLTGISAANIRLWTDTSGYLHLQNKNDTNDHVTVQAGWSGGNYQSTIGLYVEQVVFDDETTWDLTGALNIEGTGSNDTLYGTAYGDTLTGLNGNDWIYANGGNDTLIGSAGADSLHGNAGNDTYILGVGFGGDTIVESQSEGTETIRITGIDADDIRLWTDTSGYLHLQNKNDLNDHVTVQAGWSGGNYQSTIGLYVEQVVFDDQTTWSLTGGLNIEGSSSGESLYGTAYGDTLSGLSGNDYIYANDGNDVLYGGDGSDVLYGDAGADVISGQAGTDTLYGNTDADVFLFEAASAYSNVDTIGDFSTAQNDKIDLRDLLELYDPQTHAITDWVQITTSGSNSSVFVDRDGTASTYGFDQIATVSGVTGLTDEAALVSSGHLLVA